MAVSGDLVDGVYLAGRGSDGASVCMVLRQAPDLWWIQESHIGVDGVLSAPSSSTHDDFVVGYEDAMRYLRGGGYVLVEDAQQAGPIEAIAFPAEPSAGQHR